jgi:hypothetical protein
MEKKFGISENEKENYAKHVLVNFSNHARTKVSNKQKKKTSFGSICKTAYRDQIHHQSRSL